MATKSIDEVQHRTLTEAASRFAGRAETAIPREAVLGHQDPKNELPEVSGSRQTIADGLSRFLGIHIPRLCKPARSLRPCRATDQKPFTNDVRLSLEIMKLLTTPKHSSSSKKLYLLRTRPAVLPGSMRLIAMSCFRTIVRTNPPKHSHRVGQIDSRPENASPSDAVAKEVEKSLISPTTAFSPKTAIKKSSTARLRV
jgi:hypothetical protein